jgi:5'-deoxynucleotidase YfbR-like HD superfamily hydrolase
MALLHDWAETRVGDLPRTATGYFGADARKSAEMLAFADVVNGVSSAETDYRALYRDYEERRSLEARLVKAADVIDLLIQALALERSGTKGLDEFWDVAKQPNFQLPPIADEIVNEVLQSLLVARSEIK